MSINGQVRDLISWLIAVAAVAANSCSSATEPDAAGKLGYARFTGAVRLLAGGGLPGAQVSVACGTQFALGSFSAQATSGQGGTYSVDLDVPGTVTQPSPARRYRCQVSALLPAPTPFVACEQLDVTFAERADRRVEVRVDLVQDRLRCTG